MTTNWALARCKGADPESFFPLSESVEVRQVRRQKEFCYGCEITEACLDSALERGRDDQYGIWGATTARERRLILKGRAEADA